MDHEYIGSIEGNVLNISRYLDISADTLVHASNQYDMCVLYRLLFWTKIDRYISSKTTYRAIFQP